MIMHRYRVIYNGKTYYYRGEHCDDAANKLELRKVYGNNMVGDLRTILYDADTRGENWAEYRERGTNRLVRVERADLYPTKQ